MRRWDAIIICAYLLIFFFAIFLSTATMYFNHFTLHILRVCFHRPSYDFLLFRRHVVMHIARIHMFAVVVVAAVGTLGRIPMLLCNVFLWLKNVCNFNSIN